MERRAALYPGKVGRDFSVEEGTAAARLCALNVLAHTREALDGDLDRIVKVAKLRGYVNATEDLDMVGAVVNGASDLMVEVFGEAGQHARTVAGVTVMPLGVAIEVEADFLIEGANRGSGAANERETPHPPDSSQDSASASRRTSA